MKSRDRQIGANRRPNGWSCLILALLTVGGAAGCSKYVAHDNSPTGIYYPNGCSGRMLGREVGFWLQPTTVDVCQPVTITEQGTMDYDTLTPGTREVARLEFSSTGVYVALDDLQATGRIEYRPVSQSRTWLTFVDFWRSVKGFFAIVIALAILGFIASLFGGGGGTWTGGGRTSDGGIWSGGGTYRR